MRKKRKSKKRVCSLLLGGLLLLATPLQAVATDEAPVETPPQETATEVTAEPTAIPEAVPQAETPAPAQTEIPVAEPTPEPAAPVEQQPVVEEPKGETASVPAETAKAEKVEETAPSETKEPEQPAYAGAQRLDVTTADGIRVITSFEAGTFGEEKLPELRVHDVKEKDALASAKKALPDQKIDEAKSVDISFYVDNKEVQPVNGQDVSVQINLPESLNPDGKKGEYNLIHEHDGNVSVVNAADISAKKASFETDNFSTFTITWTSSNNVRAYLTVNYVDADGGSLSRSQGNIAVTNNSGTVNLDQYGKNDINGYRYYEAYIKDDNDAKQVITDISYQRDGTNRNYTYTVRYLNNGNEVQRDVVNNNTGSRIVRNIYLEYRSIFTGEHDASVYFLLTPDSNADSNDVTNWSSNEIAVGMGDAKVNLTEATLNQDGKNYFKNKDNNGNLSSYIVKWPDGSQGATWTIRQNNTKGQWNAITSSVADKYQAYLRKQLGVTTTVTPADIESITVIPYKISINNGNIPAGGGSTEMLHIDSTISIVCKKAYHYAFVVDYPSGSGFTDRTVKEGDKIIRVSGDQSVPDSINESDKPAKADVPETIHDDNGNIYTFDGWYTASDYTGDKAEFAYSPTMEEITAGNGTITFYAHYIQSTKKISVTKTWNDSDDQDGLRPDDITVHLYADGEETDQSLILTAGGDWNGTFDHLPILDDDGNEIAYTVQEDTVQGYASEVDGSADTGFIINNTHTPETVVISGNKIWNDNDNQDGKRPESITVRLRQNGNEIAHTEVSEGDDGSWHYAFENLPKYANGQLINYTVTEDQVEGYTSSVNEQNHNITNSYTPSKTSVTVTKAWNDNDNQDGIRPDSVMVRLLADGKRTDKTEILSESTNWMATFDNLDENHDGGKKIVYTVEETNTQKGYDAAVTGDAATGFTITNTHTPETVNISGTKTWNDNDNQDGKRPTAITVRLRANGQEIEDRQVTADPETNTWSYTFENLPKYAGGELISYAVTEDAVAEYASEVNGFNITNSYTPEKTSVSVVKEWKDNYDQDGKRPDEVVVQLLADGDKTGRTVTLNDQNAWTDSFENLDMYKNGQKINYSVEEVTQTDGYVNEVSGDAETGFIVTNVHEPETVDIHGTKTWSDNKNAEGNRPQSVTIRLYADGDPLEDQVKTVTGESTVDTWNYEFNDLPKYQNGNEIQYTVTEDQTQDYTSVVNNENYHVTNTYNPDVTSVSVTKTWSDNQNQDGKRPASVTVQLLANGKSAGESLVLTENNAWSGTFENLPIRKNGKQIAYTVQEEKTDDYRSVITGDVETGFIITNVHEPETVDIHGTKTWSDHKNAEGNRPQSVTIRLYADGDPLEDQVKTVTGESTADTWNYEFNDLPKYQNGNEIQYTVTEDQVQDYTSAVNNEDYNITNTHTPDQTSVSVSKHWEDNYDQDGKRPASVTVQLLADGKVTDQKMILSDANDWAGTFENLPIRKNQKEIAYTVQEVSVKGYTTHVSGTAATGYVITNIHTPEKINIQGTKTWKDQNNQDGKRPANIVVRLHADGEIVQSQEVTGKNKTWNYVFENLPKYANGKEIEYTVTEDAIDDYTTQVTGFNLTNTHEPGKTSVSVAKSWDDNDNQDGIRPDEITVQLLADGKDIDQKVILNQNNGWSASFTDLDLYQNGQRIHYTVKEETVADGYESNVSGDAETGFVITNIHTPEKINVQGTKTWEDHNNQDGMRPSEIVVRLHADGEIVQSQEVTGKNNTLKYEFNDLPKYQNGNEIQYTVTEDAVDNYTTKTSGYNLTNTHETGKTSVTVTKEWDDNNDQDGIRPGEVTVRLFADGKETERSIVLTARESWTGTFQDLDLNQNGQRIHYTVKEETSVDGYESNVSGDAETGFIITNIHTPETISVEGTKTWNDQNNQDGKRPSQITIRLLANGEEVHVIQVNGEQSENAWHYAFGNLPKKQDGIAIKYAIMEDHVDGYSATINGYDVTNTHQIEKTAVQVSKEWDDSNDQDGIRPDHVTINLLADGKATDQKLILNKENHWTGSFEDLPVYQSGKKVEYTIAEETVDGYVAKISGNAETGFKVVNAHTVSKKDPDPQKPSEPKNPKETKQKTMIPDTRDTTDLLKYGILMLAGLVIMVGTIAIMTLDKKKS